MLTPGLHRRIPMADYLAIDGIGAGHLEWLSTSPLHYRFMLTQPREETDAMGLGSALHTAVLEPALFSTTYVLEPTDLCPDAVKPRATKVYKEAVAELERGGKTVIRAEMVDTVANMTAAVLAHPHAARLLQRAPEREVTLLWDRDGRRCRGRADMLGDGVVGDLKTTRSLKDFSPWAITKLGYYRQAAWYADGLRRLGRDIKHWFWIAVESTPPHDVGVFVFDDASLAICQVECDRLVALLDECERSGRFPGMFPDLVPAQLPDALVNQIAEEEFA